MTTNSNQDLERRNESTASVMLLYMQFELASAILLVFLSVLTILANALLLSAVWKDPLKCFRSPTTYFVIGLAVADLLTAMTTEPFFAVAYFVHYFSGPQQARVRYPWLLRLYEIGQLISTVTISSSFLIVLALSWSQYLAIRFPHKYKLWVTRKRVIFTTLASWTYFLCFSLLPYAGIDKVMFLKVDLALHPTLISLVLLATLVLLYQSFNSKIKPPPYSLNSKRKMPGRNYNLERQFTIVTLYLAGILLASALPHVVIQYVYLYGVAYQKGTNAYYISIAIRVRDLLLFLKVALDAFIYAWRLQTYRRALRETISFRKKNTNRSARETRSSGLTTV